MKIFLAIVQFELRQQLKSPFVLAGLILFFLIHFLSITSSGISLWAHPQANLNSAYAIAVVETTLTIFGMLPVIVFVASAVLRNQESDTVELFLVKPIARWQYLGGRFSAAWLLTTLLGLAGLLGSMTGTLMPWLDSARVAAFSLKPFLFCFFAIVLPNMLILCALFFNVASLTRSLAATVALALAFMTADFLLARFTLNTGNDPDVLALADHSATLVIDAASHNLTVAELNGLYPQAWLLENRLLWLVIAFAVLALSFQQFQFKLAEPRFIRLLSRKKATPSMPVLMSPYWIEAEAQTAMYSPIRAAWVPLRSQLLMDLSSMLQSPLFLVILGLGIFSTVSDYNIRVSPLMNTPLYPVTSSLLEFFRYSVLDLIIIISVFYSGVLVHRERESGIAEMVSASPISDWVLPLSKTIALCALVTLFLIAMMLTAITLQTLDGYTQFEPGLYLRAVFLYNGFYYWMLCVLAILVQVVVLRKWLGMLLALALNAGLLSLESFGLEHLLYRFAIPHMVYSDMNGYGHVSEQADTLIGYWGCFCANLLLLGCLLYPRSKYSSFRERMRYARVRLNRPVMAVIVLLGIGYVATGSWIFYNTNVLNSYQTTQDRQQGQTDYERIYGQYENRPAPSYRDIKLAVDIFPEERRLESRGTAKLTNNKSTSLNEFVITVKPGLQVHKIHIEATTLIRADPVHGFYLFKPVQPLLPGGTLTMQWHLSRYNQGFANVNPDWEVVKNGTFVSSETVMPIPGFDDTRKLTDNVIRRKFGLNDAARLPALGDAQFLDQLMCGVDARTDFRIVVSTSADQIALASGKLEREWRKHGRRYFKYISERPTWPRLYFTSARYTVARDQWRNDKQAVELQVYYHPNHAYNVEAMLSTVKRSLDYFTQAFGPYPHAQFRIMEYPRYRMAAQSFSGGGVAYSEAVGWIADLSTWHGIDYVTIHELSHQWWGDQVLGAKMQGREMLNETLAQYSTLMVFKKYDEQHPGPDLVNRITRMLQKDYLRARSQDTGLEQPVMYTEDQDYISYNKGALALYVLQEQIGEEAVNRALRSFLAKFAFKPAPFATSRDLVNELRAVAGKEYQELITDLFEKLVLYEVKLLDASARKVGGGYEVSLTVAAYQFEATSLGTETEVPLHTWFDVGLFSQAKQAPENQVPLYLKKHLLKRGINTITFKIAQKPVYASLDPFQKMADRWPDNNGRAVENR
jgi:ABC-type transport system involved in multi-copper enzyme maturation permease subunit